MKTWFVGLITALGVGCTLAGCSSVPAVRVQAGLPPSETVNLPERQVEVSAKYVRMAGTALPEAKGALAFLSDEAGLRAGTVLLTREQAQAAQRALGNLVGTELRSTAPVTVTSGSPTKMSFVENMPDPNALKLIKISVGGVEQEFRLLVVGVSLEITPQVLADGVIQMSTLAEVTNYEGCVEYGGVEVASPSTIAELVGAEKPVGKFYQPIFSTHSVRSDVRIPEGHVIVLKSELKYGITPEEVARVIKAKSEGARTETRLIFLTAKVSPVVMTKR